MGRLLAVAALLGLAACSPGAPAAEPTTPSPAPPTTPSAAPPTTSSAASPTTSSAPPTTPSRQPLVLTIHATRPALDVDLRTARAIVAGRTTVLPRAGGQFRVTPVAPNTGGPAGAIRRVQQDPSLLAVVPASAAVPTVRVATVGGIDPFREPARYPLRTSGPAPGGPVVTVTFGGDVMLGRRVAATAARTGDPSAPLRAIGPRLASADLTVVNLESTLSRAGAPRQGADSFAAPPAVLDGLRAAGVDVLSLANNHTGDFGEQALVETVDRVRGGGIRPLGAGRNLAEALRPVVVSRAGVRFGFLAFNAIGETPRAASGRPGALSVRMPPRTGPLNQADLDQLTRAVSALRRSADVVVVLPHWGDQYTHDPVPAQRTVARAVLRAGADLVVGGHPHWVQAVDVEGGKLVAHSLGNLVFDMDFSQQTQEGVLLELTYWGRTLKAARLTPYVIGPSFAPRLVDGAAAERVLGSIRTASTGPFSAG